MNTKERMKLLEEWKNQFEKCDQTWIGLEMLFCGLDCDSEIGKAIFGTFERYTKAVSALVGDSGNWLEWYLYENDLGEKAMEAKASNMTKMKKIKTLADLCKIIEADLKCQN